MRPSLTCVALLCSLLAVAPATSAEDGATATTTPTATTPTAISSPTPSTASSPTDLPSPRATPLRPTTSPSATPAALATAAAAAPADPQDDDAPVGDVQQPQPAATAPEDGIVRAFRTPDRADPPAFVAPAAPPPREDDDAAADEAGAESAVPLDEPYVATVTFRATASTDVDGFDLVVIYPRGSGDFVGTGTNVECRKSGDAILFADDHESGMLRLLVASRQALAFPFDIACRFTVAPNATLNPHLIAVNVTEVTFGGEPVDASALTVSVSGR